MYKVYCDGTLIFDPSNDEQKYVIEEAKLSLADNSSGTFEFTISPGAVGYGIVEKMVSEISVYRDDEEIWSGRVTTEREDFWKRRKYHAEGELSYLNDTIVQEQIDYTGSPQNALNLLLNKHNAKVASNRTIYLGTVTVTQKISFNDGYKTTWSMIEDKLINAIGGHMIIRKSEGIRYLDYYDDWPTTSSQTIEFGKNLLDYAKDFDMTDFATAVLARGATKEDGAYVTVASVNGGNPFYEKSSLISMYGRIEKVKEWGEIDDPQLLYETVERYMNDSLYNDLSLELSVVDLHDLNADVTAFHLLDKVHCVSEPHGMDRYLPLTELTLDLNDPSKTKISLNTEKRKELTRIMREDEKKVQDIKIEMPDEGTILEKAQKAAAAMINACTNGYITIVHNEDHASELIISEKQNWRDGKYWRWNYNGLGFFVNNEQVSVAMTMDGQIVANAITTGEMSAARIKGGTLTLGNYDNINGELVILDAKGNVIGKWDMNGIYAKNGTFEGTIKNGNLSDYGVVISEGAIKGYKNNQNTAYISSNQTITVDNVKNYGLRIASKGGISLRGPFLCVSKDYIDPSVSGDVYIGVDSTIRPITNFQTIGEGENRKLQFTYGDVRFLNGICISTTTGAGTSTTDLPEQQAPVGDNTYQADLEEQYASYIVNTEDQERAIDESAFVGQWSYYTTGGNENVDSISWQKDLLVNCNDYRKSNQNCRYFQSGWIDINTGIDGEFPMIRNCAGVYALGRWGGMGGSVYKVYKDFRSLDGSGEVIKRYCVRIGACFVYVGQNNGKWYVTSAPVTTVDNRYLNESNIYSFASPYSYLNQYNSDSTDINEYLKGWRTPFPKQLQNVKLLYPNKTADSLSHIGNEDLGGHYDYSLAQGNYVGYQFWWESGNLYCKCGICWREGTRVYWNDTTMPTKTSGTFESEPYFWGSYFSSSANNASQYKNQPISVTELKVNLTKAKIYMFNDIGKAQAFIGDLTLLKNPE